MLYALTAHCNTDHCVSSVSDKFIPPVCSSDWLYGNKFNFNLKFIV
ncbi:hypothetical protein EBME_1126 [bacterium endosymbiont of Mortierella elongata FMR23-6]|nr:hypothetical protein EBME_1126 [bacterium endosymbiont of Mortierella elongata FMR23-6]